MRLQCMQCMQRHIALANESYDSDFLCLFAQERGNADGEAAAASLLESLGASHSRSKSFTRGAPFSTK